VFHEEYQDPPSSDSFVLEGFEIGSGSAGTTLRLAARADKPTIARIAVYLRFWKDLMRKTFERQAADISKIRGFPREYSFRTASPRSLASDWFNGLVQRGVHVWDPGWDYPSQKIPAAPG
jgi:hypothetical protein